MTGNRIRDSKRNPFFQVKVKDGKYSTENQVSYYGKKLPDDTFSFDISNQKVQANLDEFGTIRHITFFHGNYLMESKPGVWVAKDFVQEHQLSISVKWNGQTEKLCEHTKYVETDLAENLFPRCRHYFPWGEVTILATAPITAKGEAIDMPMDSSFDATIEKVKSYLEDIPGGRGLILLVDTGSLSRMYTLIKNSLSGDLMIINNVSTAIALDIGIKMLGHSSFTEITQSTKKLCSFDVQFFEGLSQGKNIVISCMSGVGIAEKIQEMMKSVFGDCGLDFITMDYKKLIRVLDENDEKSFEQTLLILTTSSLSEGVKTPWLSMYDMLDGSGEQVLWDSLKTVINPERFEVLKREFVKFFSMEGIVSRLQFLNPAVVVQEVELILMRYEQYYTLEMSGYVRLNLYMHIAFMFERLMIAQDDYEEEQRELSEQEQEFYRISRIVFAEAEKKYRIRLDEYELSMLYELFKRLIK